MTTLKELAAMLDAATGPSREMDAVICEVFSLYPAGTERVMNTDCASNAWAGNAIWWEALPLTSSIDAALALVERLLPGWGWTTSLYDPTHPKRWAFGAVVPPASDANKLDADGYEAHAQRASLAILRALVAALIAQEKTDD